MLRSINKNEGNKGRTKSDKTREVVNTPVHVDILVDNPQLNLQP